MFLHFDLSDIYHHQTEAMDLGEETTEVKCSSHYIISDTIAMRSFIGDADLGLIKMVSSSFFHCKVTIIHFSCSSLWKQFTKEENVIQQTHFGIMIFEDRNQESF